uniref:NADH-ubiquinone oxidoreductase chain 6 n=1 Tax=Neohirasea japonica TaxID=73582 RepID=E2RV32_9NEOP|nr:NADH dehydrogenase subunit 6 [Neohirasea japonica]
MKMLLTMNMLLNMMFLIMKHPLSMGLLIIMQTIIISMITGMMYKTFWFSYILFLMYIGGMMVLFIYMTSLMPNMMFTISNKNIIIMMLIMMTMIIMNKNYNTMNIDMMTNSYNMILTKMYNKPVNLSIIMLASYLLFTMITVFKIMEYNKGPLRMMFN